MGAQVTACTPGALLQMHQECCGLGVSWVLEDNRRRTLMHTRFRKLTLLCMIQSTCHSKNCSTNFRNDESLISKRGRKKRKIEKCFRTPLFMRANLSSGTMSEKKCQVQMLSRWTTCTLHRSSRACLSMRECGVLCSPCFSARSRIALADCGA